MSWIPCLMGMLVAAEAAAQVVEVRVAPVLLTSPTPDPSIPFGGANPPPSAASVVEGDSIFVEIWASNVAGSQPGLFCVSEDATFDPSLLQAVSVVIDDGPLFSGISIAAIVDNAAGLIDDLSGCQDIPAIAGLGVGEWVMVDRLEMATQTSGTACVSTADSGNIIAGVALLGNPNNLPPDLVLYEQQCIEITCLEGSACDTDNDLCTVERCDAAGACVRVPGDDPVCSAATTCDGGTTCNPASGLCEENPDPASGTPCDDGLFCNGIDTCNGLGACAVHDGDPCSAGTECNQTCNENTDDCFDPVNTACGDSTADACTDPDTCDGAGNCQANHVSSGTSCDDGLFCNGDDTCDGSGTCAHTGDPCAGGAACNRTCNENTDDCFDPANTACGDSTADACTDPDTCDGAGNCQANHISSGTSCDDGLFCNGDDTCNGNGTCAHTGDPCAGGAACNQTCNENTDDCFDPVNTACGDSTADACTDPDTCDGTGNCQVNHMGSGTPCDDGVFCNGDDTCDGSGTCTHAGDPCIGGGECNQTCNESTADCFDPTNTACGDSRDDACTDPDTCDGAGSCRPRDAPGGTPCTDGLFCNGDDTCDGFGACTNHAGDPCIGGGECNQTCNEGTDDCFDPVNTQCGDATRDACTDPDTCDGAGSCQANHAGVGTPCDDGLFCNGDDTCDGNGTCTHSGDPCVGGAECNQTCNEGTDDCFDASGTNCGDSGDDACTDPDTCDSAGNCIPNHASAGAPCDDGLFCNGDDTCDGNGTCTHSGDPCAGGGECNETCNEDSNNCFDPGGTACGDSGASQCDDPDLCDGVGTCMTNLVPGSEPCDDGDPCTDPDACDGAGACTGPPIDCTPDCDAGGPYQEACQGASTTFQLDGSASAPNVGNLTYVWNGGDCPGASFFPNPTAADPELTVDGCANCTVLLQVTDDVGTSDCQATIEVTDGEDPTAEEPTASIGCFASGTVFGDTAMNAVRQTAADNCTPAADLGFSVDVQPGCDATAVVTVRDDCGNSAGFAVSGRVDGEGPTACSKPIPPSLAPCYDTVAEAETACEEGWAANMCDNCTAGGDLTRRVSTSGTCPATITVVFLDECGNESAEFTCTTVIDAAGPTATQASIDRCYPTVAEAEAAAIAATTAINDDCTDPAQVDVSVQTTLDANGCDATIVVTLADACGNETTFTYSTRIDGSEPTLSGAPADTADCYGTQQQANNACKAAVLAVAQDDCPGEITAIAAGSTIGGCTTFISVTLIDGCGNVATDVWTCETKIDGAAPDVTALDIDACFDSVNEAEAAARDATEATDNCPGPRRKTASTVGTCDAAVTVAVSDQCGNEAAVEHHTRVDNEDPVLTCPEPITVHTGARGCSELEDWLASYQVSDNCAAEDADLNVTNDAPECGFPFDSGPHTVTWTATDKTCGDVVSCESTVSVLPMQGVTNDKQGSVLFFPNIEVRWDGSGNVIYDTVLQVSNNWPGFVNVQAYFINGDNPWDEVCSSSPCTTETVVQEKEPGWNHFDCMFALSPFGQDEDTTAWSAAMGGTAMGNCDPFDVLDPNPRGRLNIETRDPDDRVLRGYVVMWAVDFFPSEGDNGEWHEIRHNFLSGRATAVNYAAQTAFEYTPYAFQTFCPHHGERPLSCGNSVRRAAGDPGAVESGAVCCDAAVRGGELDFDGWEYDSSFDRLQLDFFAAEAAMVSNGSRTAWARDTDVTLVPLSVDLREENEGPVVTKAVYEIWNENEVKFSETRRCIQCWDQTLLSEYTEQGVPNHFLRGMLGTDKGKARIEGARSVECDDFEVVPPLGDNRFLVDSRDASLLGTAVKLIVFRNGDEDPAMSGSHLLGVGEQAGLIRYDVLTGPGTLQNDIQGNGKSPRKPDDDSRRGQ